MNLLGIIPARGGSKRLPNKNILDLGGKPLIQWTIDAAVISGLFKDGMLYVSTEDSRIGEIAGEYWWKRNPRLAQDDTPSLDVIMEIYESVTSKPDAVVLLQPTSPFRTADDIHAAVHIFYASGADIVLSTVPAQKDAAFIVGADNKIETISNAVQENGAIYIIRNRVLEEGEHWYDNSAIYSYPMLIERSIDIDTEQNLLFARSLLENGIIHAESTGSRKGY